MRGFSLIEVILALAVFIIIAAAFLGAALFSEDTARLAGNRARAAFYAAEAIEALRNIRDEQFANLIDGTHGLATTSTQWILSGASDARDIFTRTVEISTLDDDRKLATSTVTWNQNLQRAGTVFVTAELTNWQALTGGATCSNQADELTVDTSGAFLASANREIRGITLENSETTCDIVIDTVTLTWTNVSRMIERVRIDNTNVWTGSKGTGTELDIDDATLAGGDPAVNSRYRFSGNMTGNTVAITYTMGDGTSKTTADIIF